jgi:hypothetical protein
MKAPVHVSLQRSEDSRWLEEDSATLKDFEEGAFALEGLEEFLGVLSVLNTITTK